MQKTILSRETKIFGLVLLLVCSVLLCLKLWSVNTEAVSKQPTLPKVQNKTESLRYVSIEHFTLEGGGNTDRENRMVKLRMKNASNKAITAYTLYVGSTGEIETDFTISDRVLPPGEMEEVVFSVGRLNNSLDTDELQAVTIALAVFEDHSSEGDFEADMKIKDKRRGIKAQLQLINQILGETQTFAAKNPSLAKNPLLRLRNIKYQVSSLSEEQGKRDSQAFKSGLNFAKQWMAILLDELEIWEAGGRLTGLRSELKGARDAREGLEKLIAYSEKIRGKCSTQ